MEQHQIFDNEGHPLLANIRATVESGDEQVQAASIHVKAQLAALLRGGRSGFISAFVLCTPEYQASFQNDVARFISTLCRVALFKDLMTLDYSKREVKSAAVLAAEVVASDVAQRDTCKVSVEVRKAIPPAIAAAVGCAAETTKHLEFILEMSSDGWLTANVGCVVLTVESPQLAKDFTHIVACTTDTIASMKAQLADTFGIPTDTQHLCRSPIVETIVSAAQGREFDDAQTLSETLRGETLIRLTLTCSPLDANPQPIYVQTLTGRTFTHNVTAASTVANLKEQIHDERGMPSEQQRLIFAGKQLEDHYELHKYNVFRGATLRLVPQLEWHDVPRMTFTRRGGQIPWYDWQPAAAEAVELGN